MLPNPAHWDKLSAVCQQGFCCCAFSMSYPFQHAISDLSPSDVDITWKVTVAPAVARACLALILRQSPTVTVYIALHMGLWSTGQCHTRIAKDKIICSQTQQPGNQHVTTEA